VTLSDVEWPFTLNSVFAPLYTEFFSCGIWKQLSAVEMYARDASFWQYSVYADIPGRGVPWKGVKHSDGVRLSVLSVAVSSEASLLYGINVQNCSLYTR